MNPAVVCGTITFRYVVSAVNAATLAPRDKNSTASIEVPTLGVRRRAGRRGTEHWACTGCCRRRETKPKRRESDGASEAIGGRCDEAIGVDAVQTLQRAPPLHLLTRSRPSADTSKLPPSRTLPGRRRRACALASVRRSKCTCRFPVYSFHEDALGRGRYPKEGISEIKLTKPTATSPVVSASTPRTSQ